MAKEKKAKRARKKAASKKTVQRRTKAARKKKSLIAALPSLEKQDILGKNLILAGIVGLLVLLNLWVYLSRSRHPQVPPAGNLNANQSTAVKPPVTDFNQPETKEEEKNDKVIQALLEEKELENWKTYQNRVYGFEIKYPQDWPEPAVSGPQEGYKFKQKVTFRESNSDSGGPANGLDIYVYRASQPNSKILRADYTDNLVVKDTAASDYGNCNTLEVFSIGAEEYPAVQVYNLPDDPCFKEAYFFSLRKGFYIYDIVPYLKSGINYDGYNGEKKVQEEFPAFYRVAATLDFSITNKPVVKSATTGTTAAPANKPAVKPKVEAPRISKGRRCPEKNPHPSKSDTKGKHRDEDCCPDPDEWPMPGCAYSAHDYSIMLKTPSH